MSYAADDFTLTTDAFLDAGALPVMYTCDGKDLSPSFSWSNPPAKTQTYAILVSDPEAPNGMWYHWVIYNIPKTATGLTEGMKDFPAGTMEGKNSWGKMGYNGPCPPKGTAHTYHYDFFVLDAKLKLPQDANGAALLLAMKGHVLKKVEMTTVYSRWLK